jgi:hypothetical protein
LEGPDDKVADTTGETDTARAEVAQTEPAKAPLPDPAGLAHSLSPIDLPEPAEPLPRPLAWTVTVIAVAGLVLALFNAAAIRGWAYELKPTAFNQRIVAAAEGWYDATAAFGLHQPVEIMRGWWQSAQAARFAGEGEAAETQTGPDADAPEPAEPARSPQR